MSDLRFLKIVVVVGYLAIAFFGLASWMAVRQLMEIQPLPLYINAMGLIPLAMFLCMVATNFFLIRYNKTAIWSSALLATSPTWPFIVTLFAPSGIFGDVPFIPMSLASIWAILYGAIAVFAWRLSQKGILE